MPCRGFLRRTLRDGSGQTVAAKLPFYRVFGVLAGSQGSDAGSACDAPLGLPLPLQKCDTTIQ
jgi:hypothetical protein